MSDWRAFLTFKSEDLETYLDNELLSPLRNDRGIAFPYTPTINGLGGTTTFDQYNILQSNYNHLAFKNTRPNDIDIDAKFTANSLSEAKYMLASMHFLSLITKAGYGENDSRAGLPPPILKFSYLGKGLYNEVPVVVTSFSLNFTNDVDYVPVNVSDKVYYMPTFTRISITLSTQYSFTELEEFSLDDLRKQYNKGKYL